MKAIKFIKVFDVGDAHISFRKIYNDTGAPAILAEIVVDLDEFQLKPLVTIRFDTDEARDVKFDGIDQAWADEVFKTLLKTVDGMDEIFAEGGKDE